MTGRQYLRGAYRVVLSGLSWGSLGWILTSVVAQSVALPLWTVWLVPLLAGAAGTYRPFLSSTY